MVGNSRAHCDGRGFFLSDHFGLFGLLDIDEVHACGVAAGRARRGQLARFRDGEAVAERGFVRVREQEFRNEAVLRSEQAAQRQAGELLRQQRAAARVRTQRTQDLRTDAFGAASLWEVASQQVLYEAESTGRVLGSARLLEVACGACGVRVLSPSGTDCVACGPCSRKEDAVLELAWWRSLHVPGWSHVQHTPCVAVRGSDQTSYAAAVVQVLLRTPVFGAWLSLHAASGCAGLAGVASEASSGAGVPVGEEQCLLCALGKVDTNLRSCGGQGVPDSTFAVVRCIVAAEFAREEHADPALFLSKLVEKLAACECLAGRCVSRRGHGPSSAGVITQVDRIFGFDLEKRMRCEECRRGCVRSLVGRDCVLRLDVLPMEGGAVTVSELYMQWCAPVREEQFCPFCVKKTSHVVQVKVVASPNVLLVHLARSCSGREGSNEAMQRCPVEVEQELNLPGVGPMDLAGVVYHVGSSLCSEKARCSHVSRGSRGCFWLVDGAMQPVELDMDVARVKPRECYLAVYVRKGGGAAFPGQCSTDEDEKHVPGGSGGGGEVGAREAGSPDLSSGMPGVLTPVPTVGNKRPPPSPALGSPTVLPTSSKVSRSSQSLGGLRQDLGVQRGAADGKRDRPSPAAASPALELAAKFRGVSSSTGGSLPAVPVFPSSAANSSRPVAPAAARLPIYDFLEQALARDGLWQGVIREFQRSLGPRAQAIVNADWSIEWTGWMDLVDQVCARGAVHMDLTQRFECIAATVRTFLLLAAQNSDLVLKSDAQRWAQLTRDGYVRRHGEEWGENDCCADSLLQLLMHAGVLHSSITPGQRRAACFANRQALLRGDLYPRNVHGRRDPGAFLEHDRHAQAIVEFFLGWFVERRGVGIPDAGIELIVFSRFDSDQVPVACTRICARAGAEPDNGPLVLRMYNTTGVGISGFHYDPVFLEGGVLGAHPVLVDADDVDEGEGPGPASKKAKSVDRRAACGQGERSGERGGAVEQPRRSGRLKRALVAPGGKSGDCAACSDGTGAVGDASGRDAGQALASSGGADEAAAAAAASATELPVAEFRRLMALGGEVKTLRGINIQRPWARMILEGRKTVETRKYPLKGYMGEDLWIIETKGDLGNYVDANSDAAFLVPTGGGETGAPVAAGARQRFESRIVGMLRFEEGFQYHDVDQWRGDVGRHCITKGHFEWNPAKSNMYGWRVATARLLAEPQVEPRTKGMIGATATSRVAVFAAASAVPAAVVVDGVSVPDAAGVSGSGAAAGAAAPMAPRGRLRRVGGVARAGGPRIVMGFGDERIDDVRAHDATMEADALDRHEHRVNEGDRGRMRDADGRDLDRGAGGAWHAGRRC